MSTKRYLFLFIKVADSLVILKYINDIWTETPKLLPEDPYEKAQIRYWAKFYDGKLRSSTLSTLFLRRLFHLLQTYKLLTICRMIVLSDQTSNTDHYEIQRERDRENPMKNWTDLIDVFEEGIKKD